MVSRAKFPNRISDQTKLRRTHLVYRSFRAPQDGNVRKVLRAFTREQRSDSKHFFHRSAVEGDFDSLSEGQRVSFEEEQSPKGPRAGNVRPE